MKKTKNGKEQLTLLSKDSIEDSIKFKSHLIKLKGCMLKYVNVDIEFSREQQKCLVYLIIKDTIIKDNIWPLIKDNRTIYSAA